MAKRNENTVPNMERYGLGYDVGWIEVYGDKVELITDGDTPLLLTPDLAPVLRMVAYRLDQIAKNYPQVG
jgi:hypothetical protein